MPFEISQSILKDWESMCPLEFKYKHIDKTDPSKYAPTQDMRWGQIFETLAIGTSVGGQVITPTEREVQSEIYKRVKIQAKRCRELIEKINGKVIGRQLYLHGTVTNRYGQIIPIRGGLDLLIEADKGQHIIIDVKLTGDTKSEFGKFAWGKVHTMDMAQPIQYNLLHKSVYGFDNGFKFWVFDKGPNTKVKMIKILISDYSKSAYIDRISDAYNAITMAMATNTWPVKNTFENCSECPVKCDYRREFPEEEIIEI